MTGRIFISYRREGSSGDAGRLCDYLKEVFGPGSLFIDSDMPVGVKFKEHLHNQLNECAVFLAIIGRNWLNACDEYGHRRLDNADDWVRVEIASALDRDVKVVPVIIDDAVAPKSSDLPSDLKSLPEFQAFRVQNAQFERDSTALADKLREALGQANVPTGNKERIIRDAKKSTLQKVTNLIERLIERPGFGQLVITIFGIIFAVVGLVWFVVAISGEQTPRGILDKAKSYTPTIERNIGSSLGKAKQSFKHRPLLPR
jgi:hypothetical protein